MNNYLSARVCQQLSVIKGRRLLLFFNSAITTARDKYNDTTQPRRAIMYVPAHDMRKIEKIRTTNVDCAVLDCEDGVAFNKKAEARNNIKNISQSYDFGKSEYAVRINSIESKLAGEDISVIFSGERLPETLMVPKVETVDHINWLRNSLNISDKYLVKPLNLMLFVESAKSLLNLRDICDASIELSKRSPVRFEGFVFGSDDFCADIGATRSTGAQELVTARQLIIIIAKAYKLQAIDMVHIHYKDLEGLERVSLEGANMGFTGKQVIHPNQVAIVQRAFSPSLEKIEWARELIKQFEQHQNEGKGAFTFRGSMIDKPLLLQAENIVNLSKRMVD
ncbi:citramalyl-CoA lyase, mitochondrial-like [Uloborus diversus]|uniref:citramalyl-CoA lyase, mitochondrial-like n=1 Tax=Uloborus diversus TaxID=327109 RepID=UPI002409B4B9|nr:citramalyl-CoA lyase, mitochondrial-like [Uloborus diversus]